MLIVVNPEAGGGRMRSRWPAIARTFKESGLVADVVETRYAGHATRLTREALRAGETTVVAVGGDGTIHEVVNGFFDDEGRAIAPDAHLGVVPGGSGSDFARTLGVSAEPALAVAALRRGRSLALDVGRVRFEDERGRRAVRHFINMASVGLSGEVVASFDRLPGALSNPAGYAIASLKAAATAGPMRLSLTLDGRVMPLSEAAMVVFGNGRYFGGGMQVLPDALPDDGWLDVLVLEERPTWQRLRALAGLRGGRHLGLPFVQTHRARQATLTTERPARLETDGEQPGCTPVSVDLLPGAIRVLGWEIPVLAGRQAAQPAR